MLEARGSRRALVRAYDWFSFFYGRAAAGLEREGVNRGLQKAEARPGMRVLEVAVGTGIVHRRLQARLGTSGLLAGVDLSPRMLRVARRQAPGARLAQADAFALPFADGSFDLLWASYLLDLIPGERMTELLQEFRRVLRGPSPRSAGLGPGRLVLVNFSKAGDGLTGWERAYRMTPTLLVPYLFGGCRPVQAEPCVRAAGFVDVEREFVPGGLDSEVITARNGTTDEHR